MAQEISNSYVAHVLSEMAALYEMKDVQYKPRAYERAAQSIENLQEDIREIYDRDGRDGLEMINGVGEAIAEHIETLLKGEEFDEYETLKSEIPVNIDELMDVEGVGPQTIKTLWRELGVRDLDDLETAASEHKIRDLEGFGEKSEQNIRDGIRFLREHGSRFVRGLIAADVERFEERVRAIEGVTRAVVAGSYRRAKEMIEDIDILVVTENADHVMEEIVHFDGVEYIYGQGETKTNIRIHPGIDVDIRIVPEGSWGAALNYFTGSKAHNVELRQRALSRGWSLNEYGLWDENEMIAGTTEETLYDELGLAYIEPELRERTGEIDAAEKGTLPDLVGYNEIRGDCQVHTTWSDGGASIEEMARTAGDLGREYIAITDHTQALAMTGGLDEEGLCDQREDIANATRRLRNEGCDITILQGAEVNILKDGSLDVANEALAELDIVGAAIHTYLHLDREEQTKRLCRAMENEHIDIIFHPTSRILNKRGGIALNFETVIRTAKETGTLLEVDAAPERLDLTDELIRRCVDAGVMLIINTDAHSPNGLASMRYGVGQARRGWAEAYNIANTRSLDGLRTLLK